MQDQPYGDANRDPREVLDFGLHLNGSASLLSGRAAIMVDGVERIIEDHCAEMVVRFLALLGALYDSAKYFGPVDVRVVISGIKGASAYIDSPVPFSRGRQPFDRDEYRATERFLTHILTTGARDSARTLLEKFFRVTNGGNYDPFS
jgi:hypothetical protein